MAGHHALLASARGQAISGNSQPRGRDRIMHLIARYPHLSSAEADEITQYIKSARYVEIGRLTADDSIRGNLEAFFRSHKNELRMSRTEWLVGATLMAAFLLLCWVIWQPIG